MNISLRALRRGVALQRTKGSLLAAAVAYSASACARQAHKELMHGVPEAESALQQSNLLRLTESKGSSEVVGPEAVLISSSAVAGEGRIAEVAAQITEVAGYIKDVQKQIIDVGNKIKDTRIALDINDLVQEKKIILMMEFKSLMDKEKALMDEKKALMDKEAKLMDKEAKLMDKATVVPKDTQPSLSQSSDSQQTSSDWLANYWKFALLVGGFIVASSAFIASIAAFNKDTNRSLEDILIRLSNSLAEARPTFKSVALSKEDYVPRSSLESEILAVYDNTFVKDGFYYIVYGVKGAGKTSIVQHVLADKTGVVVVHISDADKSEAIFTNIVDACKVSVPGTTFKVQEITKAMLEAKNKRKGHPVMVVFEVERAIASPEVLGLVKNVAKELALAGNVLIVLSEANAVLGFGKDPRQEFILVEEMTREEGWAFVQKRAPDMALKDFNKFADQCGMLPLSLAEFCKAVRLGKTVDGHIAEVLAAARRDLEAFVHRPILAALKKSPGGVLSGTFQGIKHEEVWLSEPMLVAPAMKLRNTVLYDFKTGQYKLFSKAHQTALRTFDPTK